MEESHKTLSSQTFGQTVGTNPHVFQNQYYFFLKRVMGGVGWGKNWSSWVCLCRRGKKIASFLEV